MDIALTPLEEDPQKVVSHIKRFFPYLSRFQIDVIDNEFVPAKTASPKDYLAALPMDSHHRYDFHLMTVDPVRYLNDLVRYPFLPIEYILIHSAITPNMKAIRNQFPYFRFGLVLNYDEDVGEVSKKYDFSSFPVVQIMTVKTGYQGTAFLPESLKKIEALRSLGYKNKIFLDGGVNDSSIQEICKSIHKPDLIAVGHYLIDSPDADIKKRIDLLKNSC